MTFEETQLLAEFFAEIRTKLDGLNARAAPSDPLPGIEQFIRKEGDRLYGRLAELRPTPNEPVAAAAKQLTVQPQIIRVLPETLPQQEVRHRHVFAWGSWSVALSLVGLLTLSAVLGTLYFSSANDQQRYRDSDTKYLYVLGRGGIDSVGLNGLEQLFSDPDQTERRKKFEEQIDRAYRRQIN